MQPARVVLDFPETGSRTGVLRLERPRAVFRADRIADVRPALRQAVRAAGQGAVVAGFVAYEAAPAFDPAHAVRPHAGPAPLLWFGAFDAPAPTPSDPARSAALPAAAWRTDVERAAYDAAIAALRERIAAGDVYQVNHTLRFHAQCDVAPAALYAHLAAHRHGRYHALVETDDWALVSASPELFFDLRDGIVVTRPMKGTARRGRWLAEDRAAALSLADSPKDRAENLMIVDLLRNDLGRVAAFGTVQVDSLFDVETYPTVHQLTSTISARLRDGCGIDDIFAAMFPCGSVTGAPKIAAMQQIVQLEDTPRGPYCGAIGILRPDGSATFNVAIRTVLLDRAAGTAVYGSGSGITWDSSAAAEYDEIVAKAALLLDQTPGFELLETLRLEDGVLHRLELHLARLRSSCTYWDFAADAAANAARELATAACAHPRGRWRVRATIARDGRVTVTAAPLEEPDAAGTHVVALATAAIDSRDRLLHHKTTARGVYDRHRAQHPGAFDVLLHNEHGCITEFTIGNVVCELDGELVTPPRTDGLLAGVFRAQLLRQGTLRERSIRIDEALACTRMWLINSVRGWVPVRIAAARTDEERAEPSTGSAP